MQRNVRLRELRIYRKLFEEADSAPDGAHLAAVAGEAQRRLGHWLLLETLKDKLYERARELGVPCRRDRDLCFEWLVNRAKPQADLFLHNPAVYVQPPKAAQEAAERGLRARRKAKPSKRGGLTTKEAGKQGVGSGVARARDIIAGKRVDAKQVKAFFDRHEGNYVRARDRGLPAKESPVIQAWLLWGGDPMRRAAERALSSGRDR
jgi:hypothetical protein